MSNNIARPLIGVGVLVWKEKRLLLGKRINSGQEYCWQFPGGHLEPGESVTDCANREVMEETGLQVTQFRHLGFTNSTFSVGQQQYITLLVSCVYQSGEAQTLEPDKCELWQWFDYQHLPTPLFQPITLFLSQQLNGQQDDLYALHRASHVIAGTPSVVHK
jgi:8-oxo-dGTP diphosphatase